ncbi:BTAD domain-containing putative transcriptional regulator [Catenulispora yoronensis]
MLGPFEIVVQGRSRQIGGPRERRVLAILLLNANTTVPIERIIDVLWDEPPSSARQQVFNVIGNLRRHLGGIPGVGLATDPVGYRADLDAEKLDLTAFRSGVVRARCQASAGDRGAAVAELSAACRLWRGPALAGLDRTYFTNVGARLEEERLEALDSLMALRIDLGESTHVVGELRELVATQPYRESTRVNLIAALHGSGRQAEALAVYDEGRRLLREEFGLDPGDELKKMQEAVLHGEPVAHPDPSPNSQPASPSTALTMPRTALQSTALPPTALPSTAPPPTVPSLTTPPQTAPPQTAPPQTAPPHTAAPPQTTPPPTPKRKFLPRDSPDFAGRHEELRQLLPEPHPDRPRSLVVSTIDGMGGVGKTALAVHFAHSVAADYPDGQFFVDLRGFTIGMVPLTPGEALSLLLRQAGVPEEQIPADLESRSAAWRAQMADKAALVLLDNAVDAAQVRPLIPGASGALVLVTSRRRLPSLDGARSLSLGPMPRDDAMTLFTRIVGARRVFGSADGLASVSELCGRLPLAIRIAAARFRDRGSWSVADLVALLSDHRARARFLDIGERSVSAVLQLSYRYLTTGQRRALRLLSLDAGRSFSPAVVAALAEVPLEDAMDILETLFEDNLVVQAEPGRYFFHDLVRDSAHTLCLRHDSDAAREDALRRLAAHHVRWASAVCGPLAKGPFRELPKAGDTDGSDGLCRSDVEIQRPPRDAPGALDVLKREGPDLVATALAAFAEGLWPEAWRLTCALQPYLARGNYPDPSLELFSQAVRAARSLGAEHGEALSLTGLALAQREHRRLPEAEESLREAIAISRRTGDRFGELCQLTELGVTSRSREAFTEAYRHFGAALALAEEVGDRDVQGSCARTWARCAGSWGWTLRRWRTWRRRLPRTGPSATAVPRARRWSTWVFCCCGGTIR